MNTPTMTEALNGCTCENNTAVLLLFAAGMILAIAMLEYIIFRLEKSSEKTHANKNDP